MFMEYFERVQALMPEAEPAVTAGAGSPAALSETVDRFSAFLDGA
jgi:hypothetical protein